MFLACHNKLISREISITTQCEIVACLITLAGSQSLIVCSIYRPPNNDISYLQCLCSDLENLVNEHPDVPIWIAGDLNLPNINWVNNSAEGNSYPLSLCNIFLDFLNTFGFIQTVNFATRANNTLDIFCTNRPSLIKQCFPLPGIGDHDAVAIESSTVVQSNPPFKRTVYLWSRANLTDMKQTAVELCNNFLSSNFTHTPVASLWNNFKLICYKCLELVPTKQISTNTKQRWINHSIKRLSRKKQRYFNRARVSKLQSDWHSYKNIKKELQKECRQAYSNYVNNLVNTDDGPTSKKLWSFIKKQRHDYCGVAPLEDCGITYSKPQEKADILNRFFASVFIQDDSLPPVMESDPIPDMPPIQIHTEGVLHLLLGLKTSKATGPDKIPSRLLKELAYQISPALTLLYRASISQGTVPLDWKLANVVPIFKKGSKSCPSNYRPVSLTSICCKILEHIIYSSIWHHLEEHNIICNEQHGFRAGHSCETQLLITIHDFAQNLNNRKQTDVILLDFTKAFDKVSHKRLCSKLAHYGIRGALLTWINDFLTGRTQRVIVNGCISDDTGVSSGVPQGTVLAPLLFLVYINDLPKNIVSSVKLYADDVLIYRIINSEQDHMILQQDLNMLQKWADTWLMMFNQPNANLFV